MLRWALHLGTTPRELLGRVTTADIVEMMAFERLEPFGALHAEFLAGQLCATLANVHRDPKARREAWVPSDFMPALQAEFHRVQAGAEPVLLDDPEAMSRLIKTQVFRGQ